MSSIKNNGRGPYKKKPNLKSKFIRIRVTEPEKLEIDNKAKLAGRSISKLILDALSRVRTWTVANTKLESEKIREIKRIGNNLNQIARWCNQYKSHADNIQILTQLIIIEKKIDSFFLPPFSSENEET